MQIAMHTNSGVDAYVAGREWRVARLSACPLHPSGGCGMARHGSYARAKPSGVRVARWYCPQGHRTFSLLPDFLAAHLPGLLAEVEEVIFATARSPSIEAAAASMRDLGVSLPAAVRWLRRRLGPVQRAVRELRDADTGVTLVVDAGFLTRLRRGLDDQTLAHLPPPLGFMVRGHALSKASNTRWGLTRTSGRSTLVDNTTRRRHSYGHAVPQNTATRTHTHHPGHPARMARRPLRQREQRAAIPAVDQPVQTLLPRARP